MVAVPDHYRRKAPYSSTNYTPSLEFLDDYDYNEPNKGLTKTPAVETSTLYRRDSYTLPPTYFESLARPLPIQHNNWHDYFTLGAWIPRATNARVRHDPYEGFAQAWIPRRAWSEVWPLMEAKLTDFGRFLVAFLIFHIQFAFVVTVIQALGVHFREEHDSLGFFPRFGHNLKTPSTLFGDDAYERLDAHARFTWGFWSGWLLGIVRWVWPATFLKGIWLVVTKSVTIPGERIAHSSWGEQASEVAHDATEGVKRNFERVAEKVLTR